MKLSHFSSLVQLGVGLHLGTALFEVVAQFARSPLERKLVRLREYGGELKTLTEAAESALDSLGDLDTEVDTIL